MASELSRQKAAQAWCTKTTSHIEMDVDLAEAFAEILDATPGLVCIWSQDCGWQTSCGRAFEINDEETPSGCGMKFCCFCGKPVEESLEGDEGPEPLKGA